MKYYIRIFLGLHVLVVVGIGTLDYFLLYQKFVRREKFHATFNAALFSRAIINEYKSHCKADLKYKKKKKTYNSLVYNFYLIFKQNVALWILFSNLKIMPSY